MVSGYKKVQDIIEKYFDRIPCLKYEPLIVNIRTRYNESDEWEYTNQVVTYDGFDCWIWENDWWEGQPYVEVVGFDMVANIKVPSVEYWNDLI